MFFLLKSVPANLFAVDIILLPNLVVIRSVISKVAADRHHCKTGIQMLRFVKPTIAVLADVLRLCFSNLASFPVTVSSNKAN